MLTDEHRRKIKYLSQYRYLNAEIDRKTRQVEQAKSRMFNITGTISDMPKSRSRNDTIADCIEIISEFENNINKEIGKLLEVKEDIENRINSIDDLQLREIMKCRYIDCKKYEQIAVEKDIDLRWLYRLHEKGLDFIEIDH